MIFQLVLTDPLLDLAIVRILSPTFFLLYISHHTKTHRFNFIQKEKQIDVVKYFVILEHGTEYMKTLLVFVQYVQCTIAHSSCLIYAHINM